MIRWEKVRTLWRPLLFIAISTLPLLFMLCFRLVGSYAFDNDFGRDLVDMFAITQGDITLLGPKLSFGGLHTGPYYYYLFALLVLFFPTHPEALLYANAALAWLALVLIGLVWYRLEQWNRARTLLSLYWVGLSSYFIYSARGPGNAFSYVGWLGLLIALYPYIWKRSSWWLWGLYGLGWGIVVNFHLAVLFVAVPLLIGLAGFTIVRHRKTILPGVSRSIALAVGFCASFAPLALFEVTHNFVMIRNTFIDKSYQAFTQNTNLTNPLATSTNPIENLWLFISQAGHWITPSLAAIVVLLVVLIWARWKQSSTWLRVATIGLLVALVLAAVLATSQLAFHYFFPFLITAQIALVYWLAKEKTGLWLIGLAVAMSVFFFPLRWFTPSSRPTSAFKTTIDTLTQLPLTNELAARPFAVYVTRETSLAPIGSEYRYFLLTHGLESVEPSAYAQAELLLWIAEQPLATIDAVTSWELDQFGSRTLLEQHQIGSRTVYLFAKQ